MLDFLETFCAMHSPFFIGDNMRAINDIGVNMLRFNLFSGLVNGRFLGNGSGLFENNWFFWTILSVHNWVILLIRKPIAHTINFNSIINKAGNNMLLMTSIILNTPTNIT